MARVVIVGGSIAGLTTALALGRAGHEVTLCERDAGSPPAAAADAFDCWPRKGVGQFFHPHSLLGRARELLAARVPDVYAQLCASGARIIDFSSKIPGPDREPGDQRFRTLACRRATFEWVLRRTVEREGRARLLAGVEVEGLCVARGPASEPPRITGIRATGPGVGQAVIEADLVIDASGRRSPLARWLAADAGVVLAEESSECETLYYSRHFQLAPDAERPEGPWLLGPGAELGLVRFALDEGDSRTFALTVCASPSEGRLRALRHEAVWNAVARSYPGFAPWLERARPLTTVLPMGSLRNALRSLVSDGRPLAVGVLAIGDALCHTNPQHAWGASLALHHAFAVADALAAHPRDAHAQAIAFDAATGDDAARRFRSSAREDQARRRWNDGGTPGTAAGTTTGAEIDPWSPPDSPTGNASLFVRHVVYPAAFADPIVFRAVARRINLIDPPDMLETDRGLHDRARAGYSRLYPSGPTWTLDRGALFELVEQTRISGGLGELAPALESLGEAS